MPIKMKTNQNIEYNRNLKSKNPFLVLSLLSIDIPLLKYVLNFTYVLLIFVFGRGLGRQINATTETKANTQ